MNWITNYVRPRINSLFSRREVPENLWTKCPECGTMLFHRELSDNLNVCTSCDHHLAISPRDRFTALFDGGAFLFPFAYIVGDILAEVYGWRRARRAIVLGFTMLVLAALTYTVVSWTTPVEGFEVWDQALAPMLRITVAGVVAFLVGSLLNASIVVRLKERMKERHVAFRLILSTVVGQFFDTLIFCTIAYAGTISLLELANYTVTGFAYKTLVEILIVPVTLLVIRALKRREPTYRAPGFEIHRDDDPALAPAASR